MKVLLLTIWLVSVALVQGQDMRDHWILGDSMHLKFTDAGLVFLRQIPFEARESLCSISDTSGNLLLFAHEGMVYDSSYNVIPGGDSLFFPPLSTSSTQGVIIVPYLDHFVHVNRITSGYPDGVLSYSIIQYDSLLDSYCIPEGSRMKIVQPQLFAEQMQAIKHANGRDWWFLGRKLINTTIPRSNSFVVYLLSSSGLELVHDISIGMESNIWGELATNSNGSMLALASFTGMLQLFDFDRCTGLVTNARTLINDSTSTYYGCAFSSDGTKLYIAKSNREVLEQIDLSESAFPVSTIFSANFGLNNGAGQLELGPDDKIYWIQSVQSFIFDSVPAMYLGVINNPNEPGLSCNFDLDGVWLGGIVNRRIGLPNHPNYYLGPLVGSPCDTLMDPDTTTAIQPIHVASVEPCFELRASGSGSITLKIEPSFMNSTIELYNSSGTQVFTGQVNTTNSMLSTASWTPGMYVARLRTRDGRCPAQKFVVAP
ncbi:MAG: T9SS type A sorting domain-containing protein [Bacteroidetes bacterium]|nr:T9SS type A sorting domain-containing protein [Bacteroidota bacterium]